MTRTKVMTTPTMTKIAIVTRILGSGGMSLHHTRLDISKGHASDDAAFVAVFAAVVSATIERNFW
ncbi:MAG TPA: hypothetical protein VHJ20_06305 [Polyangia bacterium]|nr:hypothetical protein [Polyangia bacterium]